jgi:hypothetical protein
MNVIRFEAKDIEPDLLDDDLAMLVMDTAK